ncbi:hypothetical protein KSS87_007069 [Heliosperma pusillum]|nr:hypothetical protein KSS87_007069 [Heliosperma pusillum]
MKEDKISPTILFSVFSIKLTISLSRVSTMSTTASDDDKDNISVDDVVEFALSPTSSLKLHKGDITLWSVDASSDAIPYIELQVHNSKKHVMKYQKCILMFAVLLEKRGLHRSGFRLPASHVIHTVGPIYDEDENPEAYLESAYRNTLTLAKENNIQYVAFPAISCGVYGYPFDEAASIAISTIKEFSNGFKEVHFVLFSDDIYDVWLEKASEMLERKG